MTTRLAIVRRADPDDQGEPLLRVAFATADRRHIDQHFGSAETFVVYTVGASGHAFAEAIRFTETLQDGNDDKLAERIDALEGCAAIYVQAVGSAAIHRLFAAGVQPIKTTPGTPIAEALSALKREIRDATAPWVARALRRHKDPARFVAMREEDWDE